MAEPVDVVALAVERFSAGDDDGFLDLFAPDAVVWAVPELAGGGVVFRDRDDLAVWIKEARRQWADVRFGHGEISSQGAGVYVELDVFTETADGGGAWRLPIAVFFRDERVVEVLPQPDRASAVAALEAH